MTNPDWKDHYKDGNDQKRTRFLTKEVAVDNNNGDNDQAVQVYAGGDADADADENENENDDIIASSPININANEDDNDSDIIIDDPTPETMGLYKNWKSRFIGSFQGTMYAVKSVKTPLQFNTQLALKRDLPDPSRYLNQSRGVSNNDNVIVKCYMQGHEAPVARLTKDDAQFAASLIDSGLCSFTASYCDIEKPLRLGSSYSIKIDCFFNRDAFFSNQYLAPSLGGNKFGNDHDQENEDDKAMRLRQNGLVKLFNKLNLDTGDKNNDEKIQATDLDFTNAAEAMGTQLPEQQEEEKELNQDQLDSLYKTTGSPDTELYETTPASGFKLELRPYQKKGLTWMIQKESSNDHISDNVMHPLWKSIKWPSQRGHHNNENIGDCEVDDTDVLYVNLYSGELSTDFPRQKKSVLGGILADEMGLGKTISTMALVHSNPYQGGVTDEKDYAKYTTLVVAPVSLLAQWESEVYASSHDGTMRAMIYHGDTKGANLQSLLCRGGSADKVPNVIIASYATIMIEHDALSSAMKRVDNDKNKIDMHKFGLFGVKFHRIVLDEAHTIRNRSNKTTKAAYALRSEKLWALTGTPIVNKLDDLYSLLKYLGVEPWNHYSFWKAFVTTPFENKGFLQAMHVVQSIMEPLVLRRTKDMKQPDGTPLVVLPPKTVTIQRVKFSPDEQALYNHIFARVKNSFDNKLDSGDLGRTMASMLAQILRLRQVCDHPSLITAKKNSNNNNDDDLGDDNEANDKENLFTGDIDLEKMLNKFQEPQDETIQDASFFGNQVIQNIVQGENENCPMCLNPIPDEQKAITQCWHMACVDCLRSLMKYEREKMNRSPRCVSCRAAITTIYQVKKQGATARYQLRKMDDRGYSTKITELLNHLKNLYQSVTTDSNNNNNKPVRTVIFSQFTSYLSIIQKELEREGYNCLRFDGTMTQKKRAEVLEQFKNSKKSLVFLISLKAGGVGLNLVEANRAFLMDPWWSYAVEAQAIDRIHRMGQLSEVQITRFIVEGTIEERMLKIQDRKKFLATTLGMNEEEKRAQRIEDIKLLFG